LLAVTRESTFYKKQYNMKGLISLSLVVLGLFMTTNLFATHNRAGEITFKQLSSLTFEISVITYTQTSSAQADRDSLYLCFGDGNCQWVVRSNGQGTVLANDVKSNIYTTTHAYLGLGTYSISMTDPNRNANILNVNPPYSSQVPFHLETSLTVLNMPFNGMNSTPVLMIPPIDVGCVNQTYTHNPGAYDADGDSLAYEFIVPLSGIGMSVNNYTFPNNIGGGIQTLNLDGLSGTLKWDAPQQAGVYNIAFVIKEYRNSVLISTMIRDMQITIETCNNRVPVTNLSMTSIVVEARDTVNFILDISDADGDNINVKAVGGPLIMNGSFVLPADFTVTNNGTNAPSGQFTWVTDCDHVRDQPYYIVVRASDDFLLNSISHSGVNYWAIPITVIDDSDFPCPSTSSSRKASLAIQNVKIFPNPARTQATIQLNLRENKDGAVQIMSLVGQLLKERTFENSEEVQMTFNTSDLTAGIYLVRVRVGEELITKKLIINN
jgi:hypothetical protein